MTPEQRELLESRKWYRSTPVDEAIRAALARLDAAERVVETVRRYGGNAAMRSALAAYDAAKGSKL